MNLYDDVIPQAIMDLQMFLRDIAINYPSVPFVVSDGIYGDKTREAVKEVQGMLGMKKTGIVDFETWTAIVDLASSSSYDRTEPKRLRVYEAGKVYSINDTADSISFVQMIINFAAREFQNINTVMVNGVLDIETSAMLTELQRSFKIPTHGQLDQQTWNCICSLYDNLRSKKV